MPTAIAMPKLGIKMEEGTVLEWRAAPGDTVDKGQIVLLIESDKAETEIEAPAAGVLRHIYVDPDEVAPCGAFLAALTETADEGFDADAFLATAPPVVAPRAAAPTPAGSAGKAEPRAAARRGGPVTPAARKRARELGIDPAQVPGTGPGGRVTREDLELFAEMQAARVEVAPGVHLDVPTEGEGDLVLLLPGFGSDASAFARQTAALAGEYRVRGVNPRGVGFSDAPEVDAYDVATAAADASALCDAPAHVIGASLGAAVALELALSRPDVVRTLTLITPFLEAGPHLLRVLDAWSSVARDGSPDALARTLLPWLFGADTLADARASGRAVRGLAETCGRVPAEALERSAAGLRAWSGSRAGEPLALSMPVLVIAGGSDLLTPDAESVARALPDAKLEVIAGAGHAVALEAPDRVNALIESHLSS
jgi:pimeloyl-ACP methyl ester carboxylesterase